MIDIIYRAVFVLLLFKLTMTMYQRKYNETGSRKRFASLLQSVLLGALYCVIAIIRVQAFNDVFVFIAIVTTIIIGFVFRRKLFPYSLNCEMCGERLKIDQILFLDSKICTKCKK